MTFVIILSDCMRRSPQSGTLQSVSLPYFEPGLQAGCADPLSSPMHVFQLWSVPRLDEASIWDQRWREQMHVGRKQEPAPHCGSYRSRRTFLIAEDVKEEEEEVRWEYLRVASCVKAPKRLWACGHLSIHVNLWIHLAV